MTRVKICGITDIQDAMDVCACGADAIGFVIETPANSPRNITREEAAKIVQQLPPFVLTVGVTIPGNLSTVNSIINSARVQAIQIHGEFKSTELKLLKKNQNVQTIRCFSIDDRTDFTEASSVLPDLTTDPPLLVGACNNSGASPYTLTSNHFNGDIAVAKVYNKTLSASEVLSNYNLLKGRFL